MATENALILSNIQPELNVTLFLSSPLNPTYSWREQSTDALAASVPQVSSVAAAARKFSQGRLAGACCGRCNGAHKGSAGQGSMSRLDSAHQAESSSEAQPHGSNNSLSGSEGLSSRSKHPYRSQRRAKQKGRLTRTKLAWRCRPPLCMKQHSETAHAGTRSSSAHASLAQECCLSVPVVACTQSLLTFPPHLLQVWSFH